MVSYSFRWRSCGSAGFPLVSVGFHMVSCVCILRLHVVSHYFSRASLTCPMVSMRSRSGNAPKHMKTPRASLRPPLLILRHLLVFLWLLCFSQISYLAFLSLPLAFLRCPSVAVWFVVVLWCLVVFQCFLMVFLWLLLKCPMGSCGSLWFVVAFPYYLLFRCSSNF